MNKIIITLIALFLGIQLNSNAQGIDEISYQELTDIVGCASDATYLKDFKVNIEANNEARYSVVLSKYTIYSLSFYQNEPNQFKVNLYSNKSKEPITPISTTVKNKVTISEYEINETAVYHLFVKNISSKQAKTVTLLSFIERNYEPDKTDTIVNTQIAPEKMEFGGMEYYFSWGVDQEPLFGGAKNKIESKNEFIKFLQNKINYPKEALDPDADREVLIQFIVTKEGFIHNAVLSQDSKSYHPAIQQEVSRVLYSSPKWKPGIKDGKTVSVLMMIGFDLNTLL